VSLRTRAIAAVADLESLDVAPITFATVARRLRAFDHIAVVELRQVLEAETYADEGALRWWDVVGGVAAGGPGYYVRGGRRDPLRGQRVVPVAEWLPLAQAGCAAYHAALELGLSPVLHPTEPRELRARWRDLAMRYMLVRDTTWFDTSPLRQTVLAAMQERQAALVATGATT